MDFSKMLGLKQAKTGEDIVAVRFDKTGAEIATAVQGLIAKNESAIKDLDDKVTGFCKRHDVTPDALAAANRSDTEWNKLSTRLAAQSVPGELADVDGWLGGLRNLRSAQASMGILAANIQKTRTFDLSFTELLILGF